VTSLNKEVKTYTEKLTKSQEEIIKLKKSSEETTKTCDELSKKISSREAEVKKLTGQNKALQETNKQLTTNKEQLHSKVKKLEKRSEENEEREKLFKKEYEEERTRLQNSVDSTTNMVEERNTEIAKLENQIEDIKSEIVMSTTYKENFNRTHDENEQLKNKIKILETKLEFADVAGTTNGDGFGGDSSFLNNVIVNQQVKIKSLELRVEELEKMLVDGPGSDSDYDPGLDERERAGIRVRLYCDICEIFDSHDTEDCPLQDQNDHERSLHKTTNNFVQGEQRPFCDECEVFGHSTDDCPESEMY